MDKHRDNLLVYSINRIKILHHYFTRLKINLHQTKSKNTDEKFKPMNTVNRI